MRGRLRLANIIIAAIVFILFISAVSFGQEPTDLEIKFGSDKSVTVKVIDDFSDSGPPDKVWRDGFVEMRDGKIYCEGVNIADCYLVEVPQANANKSLYAEAEYIGFEVQNECDGDIYYCFQGVIDGQDAFTSPQGEKDIILVDKNGYMHEVVFSETEAIYSRYGFIIPEGFDGYVFIPTERITRLGSWQTPIWHSDVTIEGVGVHVSTGENPYPGVDASYVEFWIDNFFVFSGEFPEYEAPETPVPTNTPTPTPTSTPKDTPTPQKSAESTQKPDETKTDDDKFPIVPVVIGAAVLVAAAVVVVIIFKKKK
ncbi:MAG: hypothetical protein GX166_11890 [Clostridiaceae bacterium]|nr:hypothetical protein [Clostridiaceae bacterium]